MRVYIEHGLKDIASYVQKHIEMGANCHKFRSSSRPPAWSARICESRLLGSVWSEMILVQRAL